MISDGLHALLLAFGNIVGVFAWGCCVLSRVRCTLKWYGVSFLLTLDTKEVFVLVGYYRLL